MNKSKTNLVIVSDCRNKLIQSVPLIVLCGVSLVLANGCGNGGEPAAPKAAAPEETAAAIEHAVEAPALTPAEVGGLPVYPGLRRVSSAPSQQMTINQEVVETLPVIVAFSGDPVEDVMAFYAENLSDRNVTDFHGTRYYWQGDPEKKFSPLDMQKHVARPSISVMPPSSEGAPVRVEYIYE